MPNANPCQTSVWQQIRQAKQRCMTAVTLKGHFTALATPQCNLYCALHSVVHLTISKTQCSVHHSIGHLIQVMPCQWSNRRMCSDACCRVSSVAYNHSELSIEHTTSSYRISLKSSIWSAASYLQHLSQVHGSSIHLHACSGFKMHCSNHMTWENQNITGSETVPWHCIHASITNLHLAASTTTHIEPQYLMTVKRIYTLCFHLLVLHFHVYMSRMEHQLLCKISSPFASRSQQTQYLRLMNPKSAWIAWLSL